MTMTN